MLEEKIFNDYKEALKAKDSLKSSVLSFLRAEMMNTALSKKKNKLEDVDAIAVIKKQIKARQDSIEQFTKGGRQDLADKEIKELEILKNYLPPQMPEEEVKKVIEDFILAAGATSMKDMGKVMKEAAEKIGTAADGKLISELVRQKLSNS